MNTIPTTILDNFLDNPDTVRNWGLSLPFTSPPDNIYPGKRTQCLSTIHPRFHSFINRKVLSLFFENDYNFSTHLHFQLIDNHPGDGWIHQDPNIFTFIIYLSQEDEIDCGTSLYELKSNKIHYVNNQEDENNLILRRQHHKTSTFPPHVQKIKKHQTESTYNKVLNVKDKYNRLLCFSSESHHSANNFSNKNSSRLTLIGFVHNISTSNLPIIRSKQSLL